VDDVAARLRDPLADEALGQHDREHDDGDDAARVQQELDAEEEAEQVAVVAEAAWAWDDGRMGQPTAGT